MAKLPCHQKSLWGVIFLLSMFSLTIFMNEICLWSVCVKSDAVLRCNIVHVHLPWQQLHYKSHYLIYQTVLSNHILDPLRSISIVLSLKSRFVVYACVVVWLHAVIILHFICMFCYQVDKGILVKHLRRLLWQHHVLLAADRTEL